MGHLENLWLLLFHSEISRKPCRLGGGGVEGAVFLHAGLHRRSRTARGVIVLDRVRANLLVARWEVWGARWGNVPGEVREHALASIKDGSLLSARAPPTTPVSEATLGR